jgi:lipoprotein-anchoring transpeptidase ErfK/SrfK
VRRVSSAAFVAALFAAAILGGCAAGQAVRQSLRHSVQPPAGVASDSSPVVAAKLQSRPRGVPDACTHNRVEQLVLVSITKQRVWMCAGRRAVYSSAVTTGMVGTSTATPTGTFRIQGKTTNTTLTPDTGETYPVRYWIPFVGSQYGFHDSSWQTFPYGSARYRTDGSHGCVRMPLAALRFLYGWARVGATVTVGA